MKIIALSVLCTDYFPEQKKTICGGNSLNFAVHSKNMNIQEVAIAGFIGNDAEGDKVFELLKSREINTELLFRKKGRTASNRIYNSPEGERYSRQGDWQSGVYNAFEFPEEHFASIMQYDLIAIPYGDKNLDRVIKRNKTGQKIVTDFLHHDTDNLISRYLPYIEIAFVSAREHNLEKLKQLAFTRNKLIVATLGANGSIAFYDGKEYFQPALKVDEVVDTTGCGDAYQAAFSVTYFQEHDIREAMYQGALIASGVLKDHGGVA
ncbi:MAG: PfkB family carbohydrate kinase [Bacteroidales bacterium]|jgi:fructoselysine 6-kinase